MGKGNSVDSVAEDQLFNTDWSVASVQNTKLTGLLASMNSINDKARDIR